MAKIWCSRCYTCYTPNALPGDKTSPFNQNLIKALWSVYIPPIYVECARLKSKINFRFECLIQLTLNYRIDANTTALLIRTALDNFLTKSPLFGGKYLTTMVIFGSNLNAMAPKNPGRKLGRHRSICAGTVIWFNDLNL